MKIVRKDIDNLNASLTITIEKEDYDKKFKSELNKYKDKVQMKGFRKGKTPASVINKLYGKGILADTINNVLQENLSNYLVEQKMNILGQPLPSEEESQIDFDLKNLKDFEFNFDLGLAPDPDLIGVSATDKYNKKTVDIPDSMVNDELDLARRRQGKTIHPENDIQEKDILTLDAKELDGKKVKEEGWVTTFTIMVDLIGDDKLRKAILKKKKGDSFQHDIYKLEKERDEAYVKKYFLNLDEEEEKEISNNFEYTISEISRIEPAELDKAFFDSYFAGKEVADEAQARDFIKEEIESYYNQQSKTLFYREMMEELMESNPMELPDGFLKRWLKYQNEKLTDENLDSEYELFAKNLKWTLIKNKLVDAYKIEVNGEDIKSEIQNRFKQYFNAQGVDENYLNGVVERFLQNKEEVNKVYEELVANRMFAKLEETVEIKEKKISLDDYKEEVEKINKQSQPS
jgi:trigger factor